MTIADCRRLIEQVINGRAGFPALSFPRDPRALDILLRHARVFLSTQSPPLTARQRALYIRKLAVYLLRRGVSARVEFDILFGTQWFSINPRELESRIGFGHAVRLQRATFHNMRQAWRVHESADYLNMRAAMDAAVPPPTVLFRDGDVSLMEVVHPRQLVLVGLRAKNCLAHHFDNTAHPNLNYWTAIAQHRLHVFALWRSGDLLCVFSVGGGEVREWEYVAPIDTVFPFILPCLDAVEHALGPLELRSPVIIHDRSFLHEDGDYPVVAYRHAIKGKYHAGI